VISDQSQKLGACDVSEASLLSAIMLTESGVGMPVACDLGVEPKMIGNDWKRVERIGLGQVTSVTCSVIM
jgi:hypothetical protein